MIAFNSAKACIFWKLILPSSFDIQEKIWALTWEDNVNEWNCDSLYNKKKLHEINENKCKET